MREGLLDPAKCWAAMMAQREAGRPRRALGRGRRARHGAVGRRSPRPSACRSGSCSPTATTAAKPTTTAWVYAAGGYYYPGKDLDALQDEMQHYLDLGYSCVKMKIGGVPLADDLKRIEAVLKIVGAGERLAVDVNGRFDLHDRARLRQARSRPTACAGTRSRSTRSTICAHAALATAATRRRSPPARTCSRMQDARNLIRHGGLRPDRDILQFDPALSYGLVEYLRTLDMLQAHGWSPRRCVPHGGHQFALNIAVGLRLRRQRVATRRSSRRSAASPTTRRSWTAASPCPTCPASASRRSARSTRSCARWRSDAQSARPRRRRSVSGLVRGGLRSRRRPAHRRRMAGPLRGAVLGGFSSSRRRPSGRHHVALEGVVDRRRRQRVDQAGGHQQLPRRIVGRQEVAERDRQRDVGVARTAAGRRRGTRSRRAAARRCRPRPATAPSAAGRRGGTAAAARRRPCAPPRRARAAACRRPASAPRSRTARRSSTIARISAHWLFSRP